MYSVLRSWTHNSSFTWRDMFCDKPTTLALLPTRLFFLLLSSDEKKVISFLLIQPAPRSHGTFGDARQFLIHAALNGRYDPFSCIYPVGMTFSRQK